MWWTEGRGGGRCKSTDSGYRHVIVPTGPPPNLAPNARHRGTAEDGLKWYGLRGRGGRGMTREGRCRGRGGGGMQGPGQAHTAEPVPYGALQSCNPTHGLTQKLVVVDVDLEILSRGNADKKKR